MANVITSIMVSVVLTAHLVTGHGHPTTLQNGNQKRPIVDVQLLISKKLSLEKNAIRKLLASVVNTVVSVVGLGTLTMLSNGQVKVVIVGARTGGANDRII